MQENPGGMSSVTPQKSAKSSAILMLVGTALILILIIWIVIGLWQEWTGQPLIRFLATDLITKPVPPVLGLGSNFETNPQIPVEQIEAALSRAKQVMEFRIRRGNQFSWASRLVDWISFALTASITLVSGYFGYVSKSVQPSNQAASILDQAGKRERKSKKGSVVDKPSKKLVSTIGLIAAGASVAIVLTSRLKTESDQNYKSGDDLYASIITARKEVLSAKTPTEAEQVILELEKVRLRYE